MIVNLIKPIFLVSTLLGFANYGFTQCCAGGSPIAGSSSITTLAKGQMEVSLKYQYTFGDTTYRGDTLNNIQLFDKVYNHYTFLNIGYGLSDKLSIYVALGYYPKKAELLIMDTITGKGIGDLILFPKYRVFSIEKKKSRTELTIGMGLKIPVGEYDQSRVIWVNPNTGEEFIMINSPAIQPTTGSNDFIFNLQFLRAYPKRTLYFYTNMTYIMRGTNPLGQVFGDIATVSLSAGKNIIPQIGFSLEIKAEKTDSLVDPIWLSYQKNTGYKKLSIIPRLNIQPLKNLTITGSFEYPFYQYVTGVQIATKYIIVAGLNYRFNIAKPKETEKLKPE